MREYKLGELVTLNYGKSLPARDRIEGEYPVMSSAGVTGFHNEYLVEGPGVVIGRKGSIGTVYYEPRSFFPIDTCYFLTVNNPEVLSLKYAYYMLLESNLKELNSDAAVPGLNREIAYAQKFSIPKIERQIEVVSILDGYNDLIENNSRRIEILETIAQKLYQEWFIHYRFPNHDQSQWQETEQGKIPAGWEVRCIKDFGEIITGKTPSKRKPENYRSRDVQFIKTPDMHNGVYVLETSEMLSEVGASSQKTKFIPVGSLMVSCIGTAGVVAINTERAQTNQQINTIVLNDEFAREFLYFALLGLKQTIINHGSTGATMTNLSKGKFEALEVITPSTKLIEKFSHRVKPMFNQMLLLMKKNKNLQKQRDLLLPKLISK